MKLTRRGFLTGATAVAALALVGEETTKLISLPPWYRTPRGYVMREYEQYDPANDRMPIRYDVAFSTADGAWHQIGVDTPTDEGWWVRNHPEARTANVRQARFHMDRYMAKVQAEHGRITKFHQLDLPRIAYSAAYVRSDL